MMESAMTLTVAANTTLLLYFDKLPGPIAVIFATAVGLFGVVFLFLANLKLGGVHGSSKKFINSWKQSKSIGIMPPEDRKFMLKYIRSCRLNCFRTNFEYFQKLHSIRVLAKIVYFTTKSFLILRR
jgi:hypothetical protein